MSPYAVKKQKINNLRTRNKQCKQTNHHHKQQQIKQANTFKLINLHEIRKENKTKQINKLSTRKGKNYRVKRG